jgi:serine protease Do
MLPVPVVCIVIPDQGFLNLSSGWKTMSLRKFVMLAILATSILSGPSMAATVSGLPDFTRVVADEGPAVVNVSTLRVERRQQAALPDGLEGDPFAEFFRRFSPPQSREREAGSLGSGFIISVDGYVLTNAHVVANAEKITVTLTDKREFSARVIGADERTDIALLKINATGLPVVRIGKSSELRVGEWVLAIGSPFGFENSATSGIVSALSRNLPDDRGSVPFIQTDAAVNPGNSGGPLFNLKGEVVGINSQILSQTGSYAGISFAIPVDLALSVSDQLKAHGRVIRSRIGITLQPLTAALAHSFAYTRQDGGLVNAVEPGGPAARAGLHVGDIISKVNGQQVESVADLQRMISLQKPGSRFTLEIWRNRASMQVSVVSEELGPVKKNPRAATGKKAPVASEMALGGVKVSELDSRQLARLGVPYGLLVHEVNTVSARAGLAVGDVIIGLAGEPLTSYHQLESALSAAGTGSLALHVVRRGVHLFIPLPLGSGQE